MAKQPLVSQPITSATNDKLKELSKKRKGNGILIRNKQDILTMLVNDLHKKECK